MRKMAVGVEVLGDFGSSMTLRKTLILGCKRSEPRRRRFRLPTIVIGLLVTLPAMAQQPVPLFNTLQANPPPASGAPQAPPDQATPPPATPAPPQAPSPPAEAAGRVFCGQNVTAHPADPHSVPERYRQFLGIFSDADWTPQICAALIVETVADDGTATITYVFGPLSAGDKTAGGVLHGTGIVKDGALLFQNADGSQYAFQPFYADLSGKWTTPRGQSYEAIFKRSF
jgi:hypothetical protein